MSYCRFSSDDFQCDVYVYEDCHGGWTTHVATNRAVYKEALPDPVLLDDIEAFIERQDKVIKMLNESIKVPLNLPYDGKTFNDETPSDCACRLEVIRDVGYRVPQYVIDNLRLEDKED